METLKIILTAAAIPSAVIGFCCWLLQRRITKNEERADEKSKTTGAAAGNHPGQRKRLNQAVRGDRPSGAAHPRCTL